MARECRVGTEVAVANLPNACRAGAEGVWSPTSRTCTCRVVPRPRFELGTPAFSVRCSTKLSYLGTADDSIDRLAAAARERLGPRQASPCARSRWSPRPACAVLGRDRGRCIRDHVEAFGGALGLESHLGEVLAGTHELEAQQRRSKAGPRRKPVDDRPGDLSSLLGQASRRWPCRPRSCRRR